MVGVVGVIGYKNSGKTTLIRALARELGERGYRVAVVKHLSHHFDLPDKDTTTLGEAADQVGFISSQASGVLWKRTLSLEDVIAHIEADVILLEGFKAEKTFPKIVCLRGRPDDRGLLDGQAICAVRPFDQVGGGAAPDISELSREIESLGVPLLGREETARIADLVEQEAFRTWSGGQVVG